MWCVFPHRRIRSRRLRRIRWPARGDRSRPDVQSGRHRGWQCPHRRPSPVPTAHELHPLGAQRPFLTHEPCRSYPGYPFCRIPRWHQHHNSRSAGCWPGRYRAAVVCCEVRHRVHRCASAGNPGKPDRRVDDSCRRRHIDAGHQCRRGCPVGTRPGTRNRSSSSGRYARTTHRRPDRGREFRYVFGRLHRGCCSRHGRRARLRPCVEGNAHKWQLGGCVACIRDAVGIGRFVGCSFSHTPRACVDTASTRSGDTAAQAGELTCPGNSVLQNHGNYPSPLFRWYWSHSPALESQQTSTRSANKR